MEDLLANLSFLKTWIHKPAFPGLLYSGSCNLRKGLFVYRKVLGIVDPAGGVQLPYRPYIANQERNAKSIPLFFLLENPF